MMQRIIRKVVCLSVAAVTSMCAAQISRTSLAGEWQMRQVYANDAQGILPGVNDRWTKSKIPCSIGARDAAWFRREITIPKESAGRRTLVVFSMLNTRAEVYVDGKSCGAVLFPGGEADITNLVKPGEKQELSLYVTAYPFNAKTLDFNAPDRAIETKTKVNNRGVTGNVYLDIVPKEMRIVDGTVECDVSKGTAKFVAECEGLSDNADYALVAKCGGRVFKSEKLRANDGRLDFVVSWPDAPKWDIHTPENLLTCELELYDSSGNKIDALIPFRFGFRDFKAVGKDLKLNGIPIHLRAMFSWNAHGGEWLNTKEVCQKMCRRIKSEGYNYIIAGNYHFSPGCVGNIETLLETCDEEGVLFSFSLPHMREYDFKLDQKEQAERYRNLTRWCIRKARNHPCVVTYAMNHNATGYCGDMNPLRIDGRYELGKENNHKWYHRNQASIAWKIAHELDATRPIYHHESGNLDDFHTVNIYLNWAPIQERSDWLEHWSKEGVKPLFFVEWGMPHVASWSSYRGPLFIWRGKGYQSLWSSEFAAAFRGDAAYEGDTPEKIKVLKNEEELWGRGEPFTFQELKKPIECLTNNYFGIKALFMADNWRSHRAWGISAMLPWDQENFHQSATGRSGKWETGVNDDNDYRLTSVGKVMKRWNAEDCAFIGGDSCFTDKAHHYRPSSKVKKNLIILNDRRINQNVKWSWRVKGVSLNGAGAPDNMQDLRGDGTVRVDAGTRKDVPFEFTLPNKAGKYVIEATFAFEGGNVQKDEFSIEAYEPAKNANVKGVRLYDTVGLTTKEFDRLGIKYTRVSDEIVNEKTSFKLVVGRGSLTKKLFDGLVRCAAMRKNNRILIFEQEKETLEAVGFRVQNYGLRNAFPRYRTKGVEFTDDMLRDWNGSATLIPAHLQNIDKVELQYARETWAGYSNTRVWRCGNRGSVASVLPEIPSVGDWRALADGAFDLQYSPLLDWVIGIGRITFCQFDVTARTENDPVADDMIISLVSRMNETWDWRTMPRAWGTKAIQIGFMHNLDIQQDLNVAKKSGWGIVSSGAKKPDNFDKLVEEGAKVLLLGLTAEEVKKWSPVEVNVVQTNNCYASRIEKLPPELNGLSNADWAWHGAMDFAAFTDKCEEGNAALRVIRHGKGVMVFCQIAPWMIDEISKPYLRITKRHSNRLVSRLCGNLEFQSMPLAVRYCDTPIAEDDPYRYYRW